MAIFLIRLCLVMMLLLSDNVNCHSVRILGAENHHEVVENMKETHQS